MMREDIYGCAAFVVGAVFVGWCFVQGVNNGAHQAPAPVKVELTPEVKYYIQKEVQREVRRLTKPQLPMVAPDPKAKVKRK